jgi:PPP family 3-phenylpropionic acid transporter
MLINIKLAIASSYFFSFAAYGAILPFLPLILHERGLSDPQINIVLSAAGLATIFSPLILSHLADGYLAVRIILAALSFLAACIAPLFLIVDGTLGAFVVAFSFFSMMIPLLTTLDAFAVDFAGKSSSTEEGIRGSNFSAFRIWGSIGFPVSAVLLPLLSPRFGEAPLTLIGLVVFFASLAFLSSVFLRGNQPYRRSTRLPASQAISLAWRSPIRCAIIANAIAGVAISIFYVVFPRYLQELGYTAVEVGGIINVGVFFEILLMPMTAALLGYLGARRLVLLALASVVIRLISIALYPSTQLILAAQALHGPMVVGLFIAIPVLLKRYSEPHCYYSLQGLNSTLTLGIARSIGPLLIAAVIPQLGLSVLASLKVSLLIAGAIALLACVVMLRSRYDDMSE